jgi:hypothetical protein
LGQIVNLGYSAFVDSIFWATLHTIFQRFYISLCCISCMGIHNIPGSNHREPNPYALPNPKPFFICVPSLEPQSIYWVERIGGASYCRGISVTLSSSHPRTAIVRTRSGLAHSCSRGSSVCSQLCRVMGGGSMIKLKVRSSWTKS